MTNSDKFSQSHSKWIQGFCCTHLKVLIVCRGPIRKETIDIVSDLGAKSGILLSEKDSVTYPVTLAPELRLIEHDDCVHRVPDYMGNTPDQKKEIIDQIISIAKIHSYTHIFAGYGFMAEDGAFVEEVEKAGIGFVGPSSAVHYQAGAKDTAKVIARQAGVSVTPGIDNISSVALINKYGDLEALQKLAQKNGIDIAMQEDIEKYADKLLHEGYKKGIGFITLEDLQVQATKQAKKMFDEKPGSRIRLKYIGGGGGKGQRIIESADQAATSVIEILTESKALGDAQNRNFLMELNVEKTRHNEIQLLGNGEWCVALGGRDCSLQMHEQKLVELAITDELFEYEIELAQKSGQKSFADQLKIDRNTLKDMEKQSESFGKAVNLDSASTFECIISGDDSYFMEMNTRIQVEHRVTEMVYSLRFSNPDDAQDSFVVESIVEAMLLIAAHKEKLPRPQRIPRNRAGGEVRLNAMNDALQPHAGGTIYSWSKPGQNEIRDDQGIGVRNPDTGLFVHYHLAGAYDSNIALIVSMGNSRCQLLENLVDILKKMEIRGDELKTNLDYHYGIVNFCLGIHPMMKPDTGFTVPYLACVGNLALQMESFDLDIAFKEISKFVQKAYGDAGLDILATKQTLLGRIAKNIFSRPHVLAGWLVKNNLRAWKYESGKITWLRNPLNIVADLYDLFHLEMREDASPVHQIWDHDEKILKQGLSFYKDLESNLGFDTEKTYTESLLLKENTGKHFDELNLALNNIANSNIDKKLHDGVLAAHRGWQCGLLLLDMILKLGFDSGIMDFTINDKLEPIIPEKFLDEENQEKFLKALAPPPVSSADTLVAVSGGMYYSKETPDSPPYLSVGSHFQTGDPLYIIEVMKMFNKVYAEFSGTVTELLKEDADGKVVKKAEVLFRVKPDEEIKIESPTQKLERRSAATTALFASITN